MSRYLPLLVGACLILYSPVDNFDDDDDCFKVTRHRGIVATPSPPAGIICKHTQDIVS